MFRTLNYQRISVHLLVCTQNCLLNNKSMKILISLVTAIMKLYNTIDTITVLTTQRISKRDKIGSVRSTFSENVILGS